VTAIPLSLCDISLTKGIPCYPHQTHGAVAPFFICFIIANLIKKDLRL
jgi:hypothetical protein